MSIDYKKQAAAFHGIRTLKYAIRSADSKSGTPKQLPYAKSISFDTQIDSEPIYANDRTILAAVSDQGYTGNIGTTAPDTELETALGQSMAINGNTADVKINGYNRADIYYEFTQKTENGINYVVKVWVFNVEIGKASKTHETDENTPKIGEYQYPTTVYGDELQTINGEPYEDENGNRKAILRLISYPDDENYATFGNSVPELTI